jgi:hypothetical protein
MSKPPTDIPASALWLRLQDMPRPSKVVDFPRTKLDGTPVGQLAIWVLTQEEQMSCAAAGERFARLHLKEGKKDELGYESLYSNAVCVEILWRSCRDTDDLNRPAFPSPELIRRTLTTEECTRLFEHYLTVQLELGPIVDKMSDAEVDAWIRRISEGGSAYPFDLLSSDMQKILLLTMARRLESSQTAKSSAGSPPEEPPTSAPDEAPPEPAPLSAPDEAPPEPAPLPE